MLCVRSGLVAAKRGGCAAVGYRGEQNEKDSKNFKIFIQFPLFLVAYIAMILFTEPIEPHNYCDC